MNRFPLYLFCFLMMVWLGGLLVSSTYLPEHVASRFNTEGAASGWTDQNDFVRLFFVVGALLATGVPGLLWAARFVPDGMVNLPEGAARRWLEPEHRPEFNSLLLAMGLWIGMLHLLYIGGLYGLLFAANRNVPPRMDGSLTGMLSVVYFAFIALVILLHLVPIMKGPRETR